MKKTLPRLLALTVLLLLGALSANAQGTTTAGMNGTVVDDNGEPIPGATVIAVHEPTNAQFGNVTDVTGNYRLSNMNVGGPYTVTISFVGFETLTQPNVYLDLGQTYKLDAQLGEEVTTLETIEVVATSGDVFDGNRSSPETVVNDYTIQQLPTVSRDLNDFTRLTPLANTNVGIDGAISFGGLNNRYNSVFIDGAATNDYFGLAPNGTNGGQTGISPISVDGIEQFQVVLAPYDVTQGGLAGAGISAVTRTGSNEFEGSAWYLVSNEGLAGKTPTDDPDVTRTKLPDFSNKTYGVRIGGPVIKDKLFFFALAEIQRDETPQPFLIEEYLGDATASTLDSIADWVRAPRYTDTLGITPDSYEPGTWESTTNKLDGEKFMLNLDWNINRQHKLAVRYRYTKATQIGPDRSSNTLVNFSNSGQTFPSITNNGSIELKSNFTNSSNSLLLGITTVRDDREVTGQPFPSLAIEDGGSGSLIQLGGEPFSHSNVVNQDVITLTNNFNLYRGRHTFTFGTHNEFFSILNVFLPFHPPQYTFSSTAKFLQTIPEAYLFLYGHEQSDENIGDEAISVAADFNTLQLGFYAQDEFQVTDNLKLTGGIRVDIPIFLTDAPENTQFDPSIFENEGYDLKGATAGQVPSTQLHWSPRFGFNWDINGNKQTQLRGGLGIFTSRIPYVWPGGIYLRNGLTSGFTVLFDGDGFAPPSGDGSLGIPFEPDLNNQPAITGGPQGDIDLFADDFKFPQIFKISLGVDHKLPWWGLIGTIDAQYTSKVNDINYTMVNKPKDPIGNLTGTPDTRPIFDPTLLDPTYNYITLADNTSQGNTFSFTAQVQKPLENGFTGNIAYSYTHAESLFDGTIFINANQWNEYHSVTGRNDPTGLQRSQYATGSRIMGFVSKRWEYAKSFATSISLFYNGQSGLPFSYIYNDNDGMLNNDDPNLDEPRNLIYIPANQSEIIFGELVDDGMGGQMVVEAADAQQQWTALDAFINRDDYLSENRGSYAERNGGRMPFENILDFRAAQEFFIDNGGRRHTLEVSIDIFNFTNFLNKDWGRRYQISDSQNFQLIDFVGFLPGTDTPTFSFQDPGDPWSILQSGVNSARWSARLGLRYTF